MRTLDAGIAAHVLLPATSLVWGMRVEREDGAIFGFTDHDQPKTVTIDGDDLDLDPTNAIDITDIVREIGLAPSNLEATILAFDDVLTKVDLLDGLWDNAAFFIFQFNWRDPAGGTKDWIAGQFGASKPRLGSYVIELRSLTQILQNDTTRIVQADCDKRFGSTDPNNFCGVNLAPHTYTATVTAVTNQRQVTIDLTNPNDDFMEGVFTWLTGLNTGRSRKVMTHTSQIITFGKQALRAIAIGDTMTIIRGCRKRRADCKSFGNILNFNGFDQKPTRGQLAKGLVA